MGKSALNLHHEIEESFKMATWILLTSIVYFISWAWLFHCINQHASRVSEGRPFDARKEAV